MKMLTIVLMVLLVGGCAVKLPKEAYALREVQLVTASRQLDESAGHTAGFIKSQSNESLEANLADLTAAFERNLMFASTPSEGAKFMAQYIMGMENTLNNEEAKLAELMQIVEGIYIAKFGYERTIDMFRRETSMSQEAWNAFVKTEAAALAKQAIAEGVAELERRKEEKKAEQARKVAEQAEIEKLRAQIEELKAAAHHAEPAPATPTTPATDTTE
jgi:uncharacterized lipoprotein YmbA